MRTTIIVLAFLLGCKSQEAVPAAATLRDPTKLAFVSTCQFSNGARILLVHRFGSDSYRLIVSRNGNNDLSTIRAGKETMLEIETNGGLGKIIGVERLLNWLTTQPFRAIDKNGFAKELNRSSLTRCPGEYPFSP